MAKAKALPFTTWTPTEDEKREVIAAFRAAAVAISHLWDVLHSSEANHGISIEYSEDSMQSLAGELEIDSDGTELTDAQVWEHIEDGFTIAD